MLSKECLWLSESPWHKNLHMQRAETSNMWKQDNFIWHCVKWMLITFAALFYPLLLPLSFMNFDSTLLTGTHRLCKYYCLELNGYTPDIRIRRHSGNFLLTISIFFLVTWPYPAPFRKLQWSSMTCYVLKKREFISPICSLWAETSQIQEAVTFVRMKIFRKVCKRRFIWVVDQRGGWENWMKIMPKSKNWEKDIGLLVTPFQIEINDEAVKLMVFIIHDC